MTSTDAGPEHAVAAAYETEVAFPYVGLRPFSEKERFIFFGRDTDAQRLVNKIFSARLTLFYGPSGVGKSSLLIARVAPDLRNPNIGDSVVLVFDSWHEADPEAAIKRQIAAALGSDPAAADVQESLAVWAARVNQGTQKALVLILDQFERFLVQRAERPDPLRMELAAMLKAGVDVHVVLSLREEFLAGLEIFAREIVTIYDSKFRLEHLSDEGSKDAIVQPAKKFGADVDPTLVDALLVDLKRQRETTVTAAPVSAGIELPLLQIVCKELWDSRKPADSLSLDLYTGLGQRDGIIRHYVEGLVAALTPQQREDAVEVLKWLSPRSGIKQSYEPSQLSEMTRLPIERVETILDHFDRHWVLQKRLIGGVRWYEVYHDAYIPVLRPWIDTQLVEKRSMSYAAFLHLAGITILHEYKYRQNETVGDLFQRGFSFLKDGGFIGPATLEFDKTLDGANMVGKAIPTEIGMLYVKKHKDDVPTDWLSTDLETRSNLNIDVALDLGFKLVSDTAFRHLAGITILHEYKYCQNEMVGDLFQRDFYFLKEGGFIGPSTLEFDKALDGANMVGKAIPTKIGMSYIELHKEDVPMDWLSTDPKTRSNLNIDVALHLGFQRAHDGTFLFARKHVLWVDDQPQNNEYGIIALRSQNIEVVTCKSTREALEEIKKQSFDVIVTDQLRYEDQIRKNEAGYELSRALRDNGVKAPVILSTAFPDNDDARRRGFFAATNTQHEVVKLVNSALSERPYARDGFRPSEVC